MRLEGGRVTSGWGLSVGGGNPARACLCDKITNSRKRRAREGGREERVHALQS